MNKNFEIINRENIYIENKPQYITLFYKHKAYTFIIERIGYRDFNFYYSSDSIPDDITKKEIENFCYSHFINYEDWNETYF